MPAKVKSLFADRISLVKRVDPQMQTDVLRHDTRSMSIRRDCWISGRNPRAEETPTRTSGVEVHR